jgi:hypothetical protein
MAGISVGSAVGAGFGLIRQRPISILTWGLLRVGFIVGLVAIYAPTLLSIFADVASHQAELAASGAGASSAQSPLAASMMSRLFLLQGVGFIAQILGLLVSAVIVCAVTRAIVHPERKAFASLRIGAPELFIIILSFGLSFALAFCLMLVVIPFAIAAGFLGAAHQWAIMGIVIGLGVLVLLIGGIYIAARFAFVVPMMVDDGQFHLFDAWTLTKGRVGSIILTGLCLMLIAFLFGLVIDILFVGLGAGILGMAAGGFDHLQAFFEQPPMAILQVLAPSLILLAVLTIPIEGCALAIFIAPWARAYRDVVPPRTAPSPVVGPGPAITPPPAPVAT